jgi:hypothetical protein
MQPSRLRAIHLPIVLTSALLVLTGRAVPRAQSDLDAFMRDVLAERDSNWKKLQQYVLDEHEQIEMRGPSGTPLWGERRDYTWYIRDGFFVRSPLRVNGAAVPEGDRLKYETDFLARAKRRDARQADTGDPASDAAAGGAPANGRRADSAPADTAPADSAPASGADAAPQNLDGLIRQSRQPQFISSAYFLRFRFDQGRYALVGRERFENRDVLRIEYYPDNLFTEQRRRELRDELEGDRRRPPPRDRDGQRQLDAELRRLMNKSSRVTLWIEQASHQIVKYTFDDLDWNFFPAQWLAQVDSVSASMTMGQPFEDVWLPRSLQMDVGLLLAFGNIDFRYILQYDEYRQPDVKSKVGIPDRP